VAFDFLRNRDPDIRVWPALLLAPMVVLGDQSIAYALVTPACAAQTTAWLHAVAVFSAVLVAAMTLVAWRAWRRITSSLEVPGRGPTASDGTDGRARGSFVALAATLSGLLSLLVILAMWLPIAVLSPCHS
jgi:hypothetical protein